MGPQKLLYLSFFLKSEASTESLKGEAGNRYAASPCPQLLSRFVIGQQETEAMCTLLLKSLLVALRLIFFCFIAASVNNQ